MLLLRLVFHQANRQIYALPVRAYTLAFAWVAERHRPLCAVAAALAASLLAVPSPQ